MSGRRLSAKQGKKHPIAAVAAATVIYIHNPVTCLVGVETFRLDQHSHINVTCSVICKHALQLTCWTGTLYVLFVLSRRVANKSKC